MSPSQSRVVFPLVAAAVLAQVAVSGACPQGDRLSTHRVEYRTHQAVSLATVQASVAAGFRPIDLDHAGVGRGGVDLWDAVMVENVGAYHEAPWWYYVGVSPAQIGAHLLNNQARLIDIESYDDAGVQRFACVMVANGGAGAVPWSWLHNVSATQLQQHVSANGLRIERLDLDELGPTPRYHAIMVPNVGAQARSWWYYLNVPFSQVGSSAATNQAVVTGLERRSNGNFDCVMVGSPAAWVLSSATGDVDATARYYGARPIDVEPASSSALRTASLINVSNPHERAVGIAMRNAALGTGRPEIGAWLAEIGGAVLVDFNGGVAFEPGATMATLHHVHVMRRVYQGILTGFSLGSTLLVRPGVSGTCPNGVGSSLVVVNSLLAEMMGPPTPLSYAYIEGVAQHYGVPALESTAMALGATDTALLHTVGCAVAAAASPNLTTLRDLDALHQQVAAGYVGGFREALYGFMDDAKPAVDALIDARGSSMGLPQRTLDAFKAATRIAHKRGSYDLGPGAVHRSDFGLARIPFFSTPSRAVVHREYTFGAFCNGASQPSVAAAIVDTAAIPELLEPVLVAALQSWQLVSGSAVVVGSGCGGLNHNAVGVPTLSLPFTLTVGGGYSSGLLAIVIGFSNTQWNGVPLPASLAPFGSDPGCVALNDAADVRTFVSANGLSTSFFLPNRAALLGARFYSQAYNFDAATFRSSNGLSCTIGY